MRPFEIAQAATLPQAVAAAADPDTMLLAGGTELLNWLKDGIAEPRRVVEIAGLPGLDTIEATPAAGLRIGALARMSDVAAHPAVQQGFPVLAQALLAGASPQIRAMATVGGNLMQRTRCPYFRGDPGLPCNRRRPGSGCAALHGINRHAAIFGWTAYCVATHPSDLAVALAALDAEIEVVGPAGARRIPAAGFHRLPGDGPERETELADGELIVAVQVPASPEGSRSAYLKVRERASFAFALVSAAATLELDGDRVRAARIAIGGVAARPWRLAGAEARLPGVPVGDADALRRALVPEFAEARPLPGNGFKIELARRTVVRVLQDLGKAS